MSKPLDRLGDLLAIDIVGCGQDWELVCADPDRVEEFCDLYEREHLNRIEKSELMRLVVASYDQKLESGSHSEAVWQRVARLLEADYVEHKETVEYWSLMEEID